MWRVTTKRNNHSYNLIDMLNLDEISRSAHRGDAMSWLSAGLVGRSPAIVGRNSIYVSGLLDSRLVIIADHDG